MKKLGLIFTSMFLILFAACANGNNEEEITDTVDNGTDEMTLEEEALTEEPEEETIEEALEETTEDTKEAEEDVTINQDPVYELTSTFSVKPIEGTDAPDNVVLLTIDDSFLSTNNTYALDMAEILYELDVKAIFFVNGQLLDTPENHEILKQMHAMGHAIGNHTMNHPDLATISDDEQRKQIIDLNDLIEEIIGERPRFFRAPFGKNTDTSREVMVEEGMQWMNWSYGYDWVAEYMEAEALAKIMVEPDPPGLLSNGANLLMHDREFTRDALKDIVEGIRGKGFEFVDPALIK